MIIIDVRANIYTRAYIYTRASIIIYAPVYRRGAPIYYYDGARQSYMSIKALPGMPWCTIRDIII